MIDYLSDHNLGFTCVMLISIALVLIVSYIVVTANKKTEDEPEFEVYSCCENVALPVSRDIEDLFVAKCPYVEGSVRADAWHKRTGR